MRVTRLCENIQKPACSKVLQVDFMFRHNKHSDHERTVNIVILRLGECLIHKTLHLLHTSWYVGSDGI
jgi:hypothetical protein